MKTLLLSLSLLLAKISFGQNPQIMSIFDLRTETDNPKYFVGMGVRTNSITGHSFIIFGRENSDKLVSEIELRGFYPESEGALFDKGKIIDEFKGFNYVSDYNHIIFIVDERDYSLGKLTLNDLESNPNKYSIVGSNCGNLVETIIGRIGIKLPSSSISTPFNHINNIINKLNSEGLEYREKSLLRAGNSGATLYIIEDATNPANSVVRSTGFGGFQYGQFKNGKFDGPVLSDGGKNFGKYIFHYNNGNVDFSKTETLTTGTSTFGEAFTDYNSPRVDNLPNGGKRTLTIDTKKGNKISAVFEHNNWKCEEIYSNDFEYFSKCVSTDGSTSEADMKVIIEDDFIKYVPFTNRLKVVNKDFTYEGTCYYRDKKIHMKGLLKFANGDTYEGELVNWIFQGNGTYKHTEHCSSFLGIRFGDCNSFEKSGTWTNGSFDGPGAKPVNPQDAIVDGSQFKVPLPDPNSEGSNPKPIAQPSPTPNPATPDPASNNSSQPNSPTPSEKKIPKMKSSNSYYDPNAKRWILL